MTSQARAETVANASAAPFRGVVALDGPSGTGKSTVARRLAGRIGARYLDTGAMYRAATLAVLRAGADPADAAAVAEVVDRVRLEIATDPSGAGVRLDGQDVSAAIRSGEVTAAVSAVSAIPEVRARMVGQQRALIGAGGIVVEGRDIGSVVWPQAQPKVYLTASADARARRRAAELGDGADVRVVSRQLQRRDAMDSSRAISPLSRAEDAVELDSTALDVDQVVQRLVDIVRDSVACDG